MNTKEKDVLAEFFGKTLNLAADDFASIIETKGDDHELKPDALKYLLSQDVSRMKKIKDENATSVKEAFDKGHKKAQGESLEKLEKSIKDKFGIDSDKQGIELIDELVASKTKAGELDADKVKVHPEYLKMEKDNAKKLKELEDSLNNKYNEREKEFARKETLSSIKKTAVAELSKLNPIFGTKDEGKIGKQIDQLLMKDLEQYDYVVQGSETLVMKDGKRLEDEHGKPITFSSLVKAKASEHWDFGEGTGRSASGASHEGQQGTAGKGANGQSKYKGTLPKSDEEFNRAFATEKDPEQRVALMEEYEASQQPAKV